MRLNRRDTRVFARLSNLIYPRRCPVCDGLTGAWDRLVCTGCRERLTVVREPVCKRCGKPVAGEKTEYCSDCARKRHHFTRGAAAFVYDGLMRDSIARFKYHNRREYADFYAQELYAAGRRLLEAWEPDVLVPIPIHAGRRRTRGFNQAELIARKLSELSGIPMDAGCLVRTGKTRPQKELSDVERFENLKNAFQAGENDVNFKKAVLVDDIYTTGSTIDSAAGVLLESGAENVYFLCVCIGRDY